MRNLQEKDVDNVDVFKELQELRTKSLRAVEEFKNDPSAIPLAVRQDFFFVKFVKCWTILAKLSESNHPYSLPTLYSSDILLSHLRNSSDTLFALEVSVRRAGNNPIYCGCKGVGKTTLLLAVGKISAILLRFIIPIYWTYETSESMPSLKYLLSEATKEFSRARNPDMNLTFAHLETNALQSATTISDGDLRPVFLLDEFTCLYRMNNGRDGIEIVREILVCGKERNSATVILAASTTCVKNLVFPLSSHSNANYPDLNNSVFIKKTIHPIRDAEELSNYCKVRYPDWKITGKELLHKTGGVGRFISDYYASQIS